MEKIRKGAGKLISIILAALLIVSVSGVGKSGTVYAADAVNYTQKAQLINLDEARLFSIYGSDHVKWTVNGSLYQYNAKVFKVKMPLAGKLRIALETSDNNYLYDWNYYVFNSSDSNTCI